MLRRLLTPRMLGLHVLAVIAALAAGWLGVWQYGVWQAGRQDQATALEHAPAQPLRRVLAPDGAFPRDAVGRPVRARGRWLPSDTLYVADRKLDGRSGVWAVTPVQVCPTPAACRGSALLVVRGWAPSVRQAPSAPSGPVTVTGWLQPAEGSGTADPNPRDDVVPQLRVAELVQRVRQDLYGGYLIARTAQAATTAGDGMRGLAAVTPAALPKPSGFTSVRNLLYALEWWVFGGFAVFLWWRWCRDEVTRVTGVASSA